MIVATDISVYSYGDKILLDKANFTVKPKEKVAIVGSNGCGKTTLMNILNNVNTLEYGSINIPKEWYISSIKQDIDEEDLKLTALEYTIRGDREYVYWFDAYNKSLVDHNDKLMCDAIEKLTAIDGWSIEARAATILKGLRFSDQMMQQTLQEFSGGWRIRLNLAQTLIKDSDLLLLDEPTNHLDLDAIFWLEDFIKHYQGTLIFVSHDQNFIDEVATSIMHIDNNKIDTYHGNYSYFIQKRAEYISLHNKQAKHHQDKVKKLQLFVDKFRAKANKAKQAQSKSKAIERMGVMQPILEKSPFSFKFFNAHGHMSNIIDIRKGILGYSKDNIVLSDVNLNISSGSKISLLGVNGAGKSTLIKTIAGELRLMKGTMQRAQNLQIGYFTQHSMETLNLEENILWHLEQISDDINDQERRKYLGSFNFTGDKIFSKVKVLSGGEKSRLMLALIIYKRPNVLLLDEPTNHFDLEMRQALSNALFDYNGSIIMVSHDRTLLKELSDDYYLVHNKTVVEFNDDLNDYYSLISRVK